MTPHPKIFVIALSLHEPTLSIRRLQIVNIQKSLFSGDQFFLRMGWPSVVL
jgi:hypothetical protein